ncbi:MAG TPA: hypothetical protein VGI39_01755 [Polyangiaceae bacterium]
MVDPQSVEATVDPRAACVQLNRLIVVCRDDARSLATSALAVGDPTARKRLLEQARGRRTFVDTLTSEVLTLGGLGVRRGSVHAVLAAGLRNARVAVAGPHEGDAYALCMRTARRTERSYARAALGKLPERSRRLVEAQAREVAESCVELTRIRDQH